MYNVTSLTTENATACGPVCLKMLMDFYGQDIPLANLIAECGVSVPGCSAKDLLRVGRAHGLDMTAWKMSVDELLKQDRPAIVWWRRKHYCVFCGLNEKDEPVICNPSMGRYPISMDTFTTAYSGVALFNGTPYPLDMFSTDYFGEHELEPAYFND